MDVTSPTRNGQAQPNTTDTAPAVHRDLSRFRVLMLLAAVAYPPWSLIAAPDAIDPVWGRLSVSAVFLFVLGLTYTSRFVRQHCFLFLMLCCWVLTTQLMILVYLNKMETEYVCAALITALYVGALMESRYMLIGYFSFIIIGSLEIYAVDTELNKHFYIAGMLAIGLACYAVLERRGRILASLRKAHDELEVRVEERTHELSQTNETLFSQLAFAFALNHVAEVIIAQDNVEVILRRVSDIVGDTLELEETQIIEVQVGREEVLRLYHVSESSKTTNSEERTIFPLAQLTESSENVSEEISGYPFVFSLAGYYALAFRNSEQRISWSPPEVEFLDAVARQVQIALQKISLMDERQHAEEALRSSEEQLRHSQKMEAVGKLAGGVAHDFNNLITAITGYSASLLKRAHEENPLRSDIEGIRKAAKKASTLTRQLLAFSRQQVLRPEVLDLNAVIEDLEGMLRPVLGAGIEIFIKPADSASCVRADPVQLQQVAMNLAVNAGDAMENEGQLTIEISNVELSISEIEKLGGILPGPYALLEVQDTGIGMKPAIRRQVFEPFFTTKPLGKGTGLGLSTAYGIIEQSGGRIAVESEYGKGSTFRIYLPRIEGKAEPFAPIDRSKELLPRGTETILLVEDDEAVRELAMRYLEASGHRVITAANGLEAIEATKDFTEPIELMVTDVSMPEMGGCELAEYLEPKRPEMRVLFMSGYTHHENMKEELAGPGRAFLAKPYDPEDLVYQVRELLDSNLEST